MTKDDLFLVRDGVENDHSFIYATMLRGLYYGDSWFSEIPKDTFMEEYHKIISAYLDHPGVKIQVACLKDDAEVILGYSMVTKDNTKVIFAFVKKAFRNIGISKSLVPPTVTTATHLTKSGLSITKRKGIVFNPFASLT